MGIFEIIGEIFNPGPVGEIDFKEDEIKETRNFITLRFLIALMLLGLFEYLVVFHSDKPKDYQVIIVSNIILLFYLILSFFLRVKPEYRNTGWIPFIIDNPFRISDDFNRFLFFINVLCLPGKFVSRSIVYFFSNLRNNNFS